MMQAELLPTTNTLGQVTDTIRQVADTLIRPEIGENISATIGNGSSSGKTGLAIAIVGLLIFAAHLFSSLFSKRRIPDVLFLIIIGLVIGPILHWITPEMLGGVGRIFTGITLVLILFQSGLQLSFRSIVSSIRSTTLLTLANYIATTIIIWLIGWLVFRINPMVSIMLGTILGNTASAVVGPMVEQLHMTEKSRAIIVLEAALGSVLSIVLALAILKAIQLGTVNVGSIIGQIFSSFVLSIIMGILGAIFWAFILDKVRLIKNSILTTPAFVFIIYGINEWMGYSGAIAALAFGVCLANIERIYGSWLKRIIKKEPTQLNETEKSLFSEITLLLKTFFFIFVGISIQLNEFKPIIIGLGITVVIYIMRIFVVRFSILKKYDIPNIDRIYMAVLNPKGLTAAVIATTAAETVPHGTAIKNVVFSVILFSIVITSVLVPLIEKKESVNRFYSRLLGLKNEDEAILTEATNENNSEEE